MPFAGIRFVDRQAVIQEARGLAARMRAEHPEIARVILFGSFARGGGGPRSDLDFLVVVRHTSLAPRERSYHYMPLSKRPIDLFVYTETELDRFEKDPPPLLREALGNGTDLLE